EVEVRDGLPVDDAERVEALRRQVHVPVRGERRRGHEEDVLRREERGQLAVDARVGVSHAAGLWPRRGRAKPPSTLVDSPSSRANLRAMTAPTTLRTETADGVRSIVFCRAAEYNTITPTLRDELAAAIDDAD